MKYNAKSLQYINKKHIEAQQRFEVSTAETLVLLVFGHKQCTAQISD